MVGDAVKMAVNLPRHYIELQEVGSDWSYNTIWGDQMVKAIDDWVARIVPAGAIVLDLGCGEGRGVETLERLGCKAIGVDLCKVKLEVGISRGLDLRYDDIHKLVSFGDKSVDYTFASHCLEHTLDIEMALRSILRVTRRQLLYIVPIRETQEFVAKYNPAHTSPIGDPSELLNLLDSMLLRHESFEVSRSSRELWGIVDAI